MSDYLIFSFSSAMLYFISLIVIDFAYGKTKKTRQFLVCLVVVVFSILNGWAMSVNQNKLPLNIVDKEWDRYVIYCKQTHTSWNDLTFPEWLSLKISE